MIGFGLEAICTYCKEDHIILNQTRLQVADLAFPLGRDFSTLLLTLQLKQLGSEQRQRPLFVLQLRSLLCTEDADACAAQVVMLSRPPS